jgi:hypothetical protein
MRDSPMRYARATNSKHYRTPMQSILVVPGLLAQPAQALAAVPSLARLAMYAPPPTVVPEGIAAALFRALGVRADTPPAPLAALGAGLDPGADYVMSADPVELAADRDDVVLLRRVDDLAAGDAAALAAMLDAHFASDGLRFETPRADAWFVRCASEPAIDTTPLDVARGRGIFTSLPRGAEARTWTRWQNEIQMLLHEHPVNLAREAAGQSPVSAIWFWGGGHVVEPAPIRAAAMLAGSGATVDLARGIARHSGAAVVEIERETTARAMLGAAQPADAPQATIVALEGIADAAALATLDSHWLSPSLALLAQGSLDAVHLVADGNGTVAHWSAARPGWWQRMTAGARRKAFVVPAPHPP